MPCLQAELAAASGRTMKLFKISACLLTTGQMSLLGHQWRDLVREADGSVAREPVSLHPHIFRPIR